MHDQDLVQRLVRWLPEDGSELPVAILRGPAGPMILARARQYRPLVSVIGHIRRHLGTPLRVEEIARQAA